MLNKFMVAGRLTADPEIQTKGESRLCKFTIACDRPKRKGEENPETDFFTCTAWNRNADVIADWFGKLCYEFHYNQRSRDYQAAVMSGRIDQSGAIGNLLRMQAQRAVNETMIYLWRDE